MSLFRTCSLVCLYALGAAAQVRDLVSNDDGSVLLFSSTLRVAGTNDGPQYKILKWDGKFSVVHAPPATPETVLPSDALAPAVSGDGRTYGYSVRPGCESICIGPNIVLTYISPGSTTQTSGYAFLSRNGRFGLSAASGILELRRIDLLTGEIQVASTSEAGLGVTDDGEVLMRSRRGLRLAAPRSLGRLISESSEIPFATVSANGRRVLYTIRHDGHVELRDELGTLATIEDKPVFDQPTTGFKASLSSDGRRAVVVTYTPDSAEAFWVDLDSRVRQELGPVRERAATLSGDGRIAWLFEADGRIARMKLDSGEREWITGTIPAVKESAAPAVRGSLTEIVGAGFGGDAKWHVTLSAAERTIEVPVMLAGEAGIHYQVPWLLPDEFAKAWMGIHREGEELELIQPFEGLESVGPSFWTYGTTIKAIHQNYTRLVTAGDPALAGEVVHIYMSGLGPVTPVQADFAPTPVDSPVFVASPFSCSLGDVPARVLFAGLAAGMTGVYQVDLEIPPSGAGLLTCRVSRVDADARAASGLLPVAQQ